MVVAQLQFQGRAVLLLVLIGIFCGSLGTMFWIGPEQFSERSGIDFSVSGESRNGSEVNFEKLNTTLELLEDQHVTKIDRQTLMSGAINGMVGAMEDPYTTYMDVEESKHFADGIDSSFEGIGAEVILEDDKVKVVLPYKGSPAEKAGVRSNDYILSVNGDSLKGLDLRQAIKKIRGPKGTQAKLMIERIGVSEPIQIIVVRDKIPIETVHAKLLTNKIGKIEITQFSTNTAEHFNKALLNLEEQGMRGLIIDVRNNPGGLLDSVSEILENFVPKDQILYQKKTRDKEVEITYSNGSSKSYPITVLINENSASASEIMAAALKETIGSKLIGTKTFGKGSVQATYADHFKDGSNLKITVAKWLTPKGNIINKKGVKPDFEVKPSSLFDVAPLAKKQTFSFDMVAEDIKNAQLILKGIGIHQGRTDGYFDRSTEKSLRDFQKRNKLTVNGQLDRKTASNLEQATVRYLKDEKNDIQLDRAVLETKKRIGQ
jgi:carboxyl-terminal processing protease